VESDDYRYLTTTGRRTGRPHRIEIWYAIDGSVVYLLAGGGHSSDWVRNAIFDPIVQVEIAGEIHSGLARMAGDDDEAARARTLVFEKYAPRSDDDLSEWRDRATPVAVEMRSG
jgi:deazaflavin-dependent oxidoreductase (nitroreductase family)